jgi:hypothetical protein
MGYQFFQVDGRFPGDVAAGNGKVVRATSADGTQQIYMYHTGTFGQIESSTGFVLYSDTTGAAIVGTSDPQLKVQYGGGSFNSVTINHDDSKGVVGTSTGNLVLNPAGSVVVKNGAVPGSATATGVAGQVAWDGSFLYICVATNTWRRTAHATW